MDTWKNELKPAGTYGPFLPVIVQEDGTQLNQSIPVLKWAAHTGGFATKDAKQEFESEYVFQICKEYMDADGSMKALFNAEAPDDVVEKTVTLIKEKLVAPFDARFADGRKFASGEDPTAADFQIACYVTRIM